MLSSACLVGSWNRALVFTHHESVLPPAIGGPQPQGKRLFSAEFDGNPIVGACPPGGVKVHHLPTGIVHQEVGAA